MLGGGKRYTQLYAVTVTLHPKVRKYTAEEQYNKYAHDVAKSIRDLFPKCQLTLVTELTKTFDIHFHGVIRFVMDNRSSVNWCRRFRDRFRNHPVIGFVLLKVVDDDEKWKEYMMKSIDEFRSDLKLQPVITDDLQWTDLITIFSLETISRGQARSGESLDAPPTVVGGSSALGTP